MPIDSQCPHCKVVFKLDESFAGQHVVCTKCNNQYQVAANTKRVQPPAAPPAAQPAPAINQPPSASAVPRSRRPSRASFLNAPNGGSRFRTLLWLGLLLFIGTFSIKQIIINYAFVRTNAGTELARVELARTAARNKITAKADQLEKEVNQIRLGGPSVDQSKIQAKRDELNELYSSNRIKMEELNKKYSKLQNEAQVNATASLANSLQLLKITWWLKLLLDLAKIVGCFLVLYSAFNIVCDRHEEAQVKTFATVCAGITLTAILVMNVFTMVG